jgi:hypothetical protein
LIYSLGYFATLFFLSNCLQGADKEFNYINMK